MQNQQQEIITTKEMQILVTEYNSVQRDTKDSEIFKIDYTINA